MSRERCSGAVRTGIAAGALAVLGLSIATGPAAADWNYTQWGMTPSEVVAASGDAAQPNPDRALDADGLTAGLVAPYQGEALAFTAVFLFDDASRLRYVSLDPVERTSCPRIVKILAAHYGTPEGQADMVTARTMRWDDVTNDNLVTYLDLGQGDCSVQYSRLPPTRPDGKGL